MDYKAETYHFPHIRSALSTSNAMRMMLLALLPSAGSAVYHFGTRAILHMVVCVITCMVAEFAFEAFANLPLEAADLSSAVTGMLIALLLPVNAPLWAGALGSLFATVVVRMVLGVYLKVRLNPALTGYLFLLLVFPEFMRDYSFGEYGSVTILGEYLSGGTADPLPYILGNTNGGMGTTALVAVVLGAILLIAAGIIRFRIPAWACLSFAVTLCAAGGSGFDTAELTIQFCGGAFMFIIWFMSVDYMSSPVTSRGQALYGVIIGIAAGVLRILHIEEAAVYAVLLGNLLVPLLERFTVPKPFGSEGRLGMRRS